MEVNNGNKSDNLLKIEKQSNPKVEPPYPSSYGLNSTSTVLLGGWIWQLITQGGLWAIKQQTNKQANKQSTKSDEFIIMESQR